MNAGLMVADKRKEKGAALCAALFLKTKKRNPLKQKMRCASRNLVHKNTDQTTSVPLRVNAGGSSSDRETLHPRFVSVINLTPLRALYLIRFTLCFLGDMLSLNVPTEERLER